jgi:hypothetical protein
MAASHDNDYKIAVCLISFDRRASNEKRKQEELHITSCNTLAWLKGL